jgi:predicted ABC-type ATPase
MFAGPNGSGKSTFKTLLPSELVGIYLNPDEIETEIAKSGYIDVASRGIVTTTDEVTHFFERSELFRKSGVPIASVSIVSDGRIQFENVPAAGYLAAAAIDFLRTKLLEQQISFTFETVMSHPSKIAVLKQSKELGFRTYIYFIATDDPIININRVRRRVDQGGHAVPEDKIRSRYYRSLDLLIDAIRNTNRAYVYDNTITKKPDEHDPTWLAEITEGKELEMKVDSVPAWFRHYVLDKISQPPM